MFVCVLTSRWQHRTSRWMPATLKTQEEDDVGGNAWCTQNHIYRDIYMPNHFWTLCFGKDISVDAKRTPGLLLRTSEQV